MRAMFNVILYLLTIKLSVANLQPVESVVECQHRCSEDCLTYTITASNDNCKLHIPEICLYYTFDLSVKGHCDRTTFPKTCTYTLKPIPKTLLPLNNTAVDSFLSVKSSRKPKLGKPDQTNEEEMTQWAEIAIGKAILYFDTPCTPASVTKEPLRGIDCDWELNCDCRGWNQVALLCSQPCHEHLPYSHDSGLMCHKPCDQPGQNTNRVGCGVGHDRVCLEDTGACVSRHVMRFVDFVSVIMNVIPGFGTGVSAAKTAWTANLKAHGKAVAWAAAKAAMTKSAKEAVTKFRNTPGIDHAFALMQGDKDRILEEGAVRFLSSNMPNDDTNVALEIAKMADPTGIVTMVAGWIPPKSCELQVCAVDDCEALTDVLPSYAVCGIAYEGTNYMSKWMTIGEGDTDVDALVESGLNDKTSSIKVTPGCTLTAFRHGGFVDRVGTFTENQPRIQNDNQYSSFKCDCTACVGNGMGGSYYPTGDTLESNALLACESVYGKGKCSSSACDMCNGRGYHSIGVPTPCNGATMWNFHSQDSHLGEGCFWNCREVLISNDPVGRGGWVSRCGTTSDTSLSHADITPLSGATISDTCSEARVIQSKAKCIDDIHWHDSAGDNCAKYSADNWCAMGTYGSNWNKTFFFKTYYNHMNGMDAEQSCCSCGRGVPEAPKAKCIDDIHWHSSAGSNCAKYTKKKWCAKGTYGPGWKNGKSFEDFKDANGIDASQACCSCGKGASEAAKAKCIDDIDWYDSGGDNCARYSALNFCAMGTYGPNWKLGESFEDYKNGNGIDASQACCSCGKNGPVTNSPTSSPTNPPTTNSPTTNSPTSPPTTNSPTRPPTVCPFATFDIGRTCSQTGSWCNDNEAVNGCLGCHRCGSFDRQSGICPECASGCPLGTFDIERTCSQFGNWCNDNAAVNGCLGCNHCDSSDRQSGKCPECGSG